MKRRNAKNTKLTVFISNVGFDANPNPSPLKKKPVSMKTSGTYVYTLDLVTSHILCI